MNGLLSRLDEAFLRERVLTADVAHELRTPLAGLRPTLEVTLSRSRDSAEYERALKTCESICVDTQRVVESLLSLANIDKGRTIPERSDVDVEKLLRSVWETCCDRARERTLNIAFEGNSRVLLKTNSTQLQVVIGNLFENAVEYTDAGGRITASCDCDTREVHFVVANSGCNVDEKQMSQMFDRFWRADRSRSATGARAGLGLALAQRILDTLDGTIDAVNRDGMSIATVRFAILPNSMAIDEDSSAIDVYETVGYSASSARDLR